MSKEVDYRCDNCKSKIYRYLWLVSVKHLCYECYREYLFKNEAEKIDVIQVRYSGKYYTYLCEANTLKVGDIVLVAFGKKRIPSV